MKKTIYTLFVSLTLGVILASCGGSSTGTTVVNSYSGAGSKWDITLNSDNTYEITHKPDALAATAIDMTVKGIYENLNSGFMKLTVTEATGTDAPAVGDTAHAFEVESYAFFLRPTDSSGELITMVKAGACPTADLSGNWVTTRNLKDVELTTGVGVSANAVTEKTYGTFLWDNATSTITLPQRYAVGAPTVDLGAGTGGSVTCADGVATLGAGKTLFLTANGGAIVHDVQDASSGGTGVGGASLRDDTIITAFKKEHLGTSAVFDGEYVGVMTFSNITSSSAVKPVTLTCTGGTCNGREVNVDDGVPFGLSAATVITAVDSPSDGFGYGMITIGGVARNITCMIDTDAASTGKNLISCSGQAVSNPANLFNMLLVSKEATP